MDAKQYEKISEPFRKDSRRKIINGINKLLTILGYIAYPILLVVAFLYEKNELIKLIVIPATGFLLLTLVRKKINRQRPYESLEIQPLIHKDTKGNSMPSRHTFCMAMIALSWFIISPSIGIVLFISSIIMGLIRVIGGIHYLSDVIVALLSALCWGLWYLW